MLISHFDSLRRRFVKIKETPYGRPHAMVRGGICPPVKNGNVEGSKNRWYWLSNDGRWRCKMQYQWMNGALCRNNASVGLSYFQNVFGFWGFVPDLCRSSILGPSVMRRPLSPLPLRGEYPGGAQAYIRI